MISVAPPVLDQSIHVVPTFTLENGRTLRDVPVAYKTWGHLNESTDNVMIICHAFTGSADVEDWSVPSPFYPHFRSSDNAAGGARSWAVERHSTPVDSSSFAPTSLVRRMARLHQSRSTQTPVVYTAPSSRRRPSAMTFGASSLHAAQ